MNIQGLLLCSRFAFPPNSLSLCGPEKQSDLKFYTTQQKADVGTRDILSLFQTMYPYLCFIAKENNIADPFDPRVVEAYWIGNSLLLTIKPAAFAKHFLDTFSLAKKMKKKQLTVLLNKLPRAAFPHHSFHVLHVWRRTGNIDSYHSLQTMEACIINWGKVVEKNATSIVVASKKLDLVNDTLVFGKDILRAIQTQGAQDNACRNIFPGDFVAYHWGRFVKKLTNTQQKNLQFFTNHALQLTNPHSFFYETNTYLYSR